MIAWFVAWNVFMVVIEGKRLQALMNKLTPEELDPLGHSHAGVAPIGGDEGDEDVKEPVSLEDGPEDGPDPPGYSREGAVPVGGDEENEEDVKESALLENDSDGLPEESDPPSLLAEEPGDVEDGPEDGPDPPGYSRDGAVPVGGDEEDEEDATESALLEDDSDVLPEESDPPSLLAEEQNEDENEVEDEHNSDERPGGGRGRGRGAKGGRGRQIITGSGGSAGRGHAAADSWDCYSHCRRNNCNARGATSWYKRQCCPGSYYCR